MEALIIPYMAVTSGWSGGSLPGHKFFPSFVPEILFALGFGFALWPLIGWYCLIAVIWSYLWQQSGTAPGLHWGKGGYNPKRGSTLKPFVDILAEKLDFHPSTANYCRLYMSVKGFLIGLPVGGIPLMILWPLGYQLGEWIKHDHWSRETIAGLGAGISIYIFMVMT